MFAIKEIDSRKDFFLDQISQLYKQVWKNSDENFLDRLKRHSTYEGFSGRVAVTESNELVGFAYGYTSLPEQYYRGLLEKHLSAEEAAIWLNDCFEFVELGVHPSYRRQGIAALLHNNLLDGVPNNSSVLTTQTDNIAARSLYESLGWEVIKDKFLPFQDESKPYIIMGKIKR